MNSRRNFNWKLPVFALAGLGFSLVLYAQQTSGTDASSGQQSGRSDQASCGWMSAGPLKVTLFGKNTSLSQILSMRMGWGQGGQGSGGITGQGTSGRVRGWITEIQAGSGGSGGAGGMGGGTGSGGAGGVNGGSSGSGTGGFGMGNDTGGAGKTDGTTNRGFQDGSSGFNRGTDQRFDNNTGADNQSFNTQRRTTEQRTRTFQRQDGSLGNGTTEQRTRSFRQQDNSFDNQDNLNDQGFGSQDDLDNRGYNRQIADEETMSQQGQQGMSSRQRTMQGATGQGQNAFEVIRAMDENGKEIQGMSGLVLYYLQTDKSRDLINSHQNQGLMIRGTVYPNERVLQVDSFRPAPMATQAQITVEGVNMNLCQTIKQAGAKNAACDRYPQSVLHVTRVVSRSGGQAAMMEGGTSAVPDMTGWFLHYVPNNQSQQLMASHMNHTVQVTGTVFPDKHLILVNTVRHIAGPGGSTGGSKESQQGGSMDSSQDQSQSGPGSSGQSQGQNE